MCLPWGEEFEAGNRSRELIPTREFYRFNTQE